MNKELTLDMFIFGSFWDNVEDGEDSARGTKRAKGQDTWPALQFLHSPPNHISSPAEKQPPYSIPLALENAKERPCGTPSVHLPV